MKSVTAAEAVAVLNRALRLDPGAARALFEHRIACARAIADDPSARARRKNGKGGWTASVVSPVNAMFGISNKSRSYISAEYTVRCQDCSLMMITGRVGDTCCVCHGVLVLGELTGFRELSK